MRAVEVTPSPKSQAQLAIVPSGSLLPSLKLQVSPLQLEVNAATGGWFAGVGATVWVTELVALPLSVTVSRTV